MKFGLNSKIENDTVAVEEPLEIRLSWPSGDGFEERKVAITMRTPGNDYELSIGFLFTEGIIQSIKQVLSVCRPKENTDQITSNIIIVNCSGSFSEDVLTERNFYITSSCGICGKSSIDALKTKSSYLIADDDFSVSVDTISRLPQQLISSQEIFEGTGGIHAAGLFDQQGIVGNVFEDIGRHNALDKLIGSHLENNHLPLNNFGVLVSGRASFELVQKAMMAGCSMLAAVGAPSSLAIDLAWESNMTLVAFLRDGRFNVYSGKSRIRR
ncbi:MAG: formate dehydrogenase accessory sulfurtransferase FdhD [Pseudomonadota bacterium]|nr:formate dehydrogenase accessory sulfurtransferase FdhD [Pseudomonadota bacterium]